MDGIFKLFKHIYIYTHSKNYDVQARKQQVNRGTCGRQCLEDLDVKLYIVFSP